MSGFELNERLVQAGGIFVQVVRTAPIYRLWSIGDHYPGMIRSLEFGAAIEVELWELDAFGMILILQEEPAGLTLGRLLLEDEREVLGILAEPYLLEGQTEITHFGGWRGYMESGQA